MPELAISAGEVSNGQSINVGQQLRIKSNINRNSASPHPNLLLLLPGPGSKFNATSQDERVGFIVYSED